MHSLQPLPPRQSLELPDGRFPINFHVPLSTPALDPSYPPSSSSSSAFPSPLTPSGFTYADSSPPTIFRPFSAPVPGSWGGGEWDAGCPFTGEKSDSRGYESIKMERKKGVRLFGEMGGGREHKVSVYDRLLPSLVFRRVAPSPIPILASESQHDLTFHYWFLNFQACAPCRARKMKVSSKAKRRSRPDGFGTDDVFLFGSPVFLLQILSLKFTVRRKALMYTLREERHHLFLSSQDPTPSARQTA